ncbi:hypothetical protein LTR70_010414 [Exophiala xenobiotica]|uniref:Cupin type-1 domain-containing protein n=1 Tax=Lithohypha guttulata TaxID=1690604 RepID=A0ABR0JVN2_9EURO|nr:hypothetical protein LTR24_010379 [Lithohypha guttulata]KAK5309303.1 hypothetical protein LTR70_010414 [Exophiala xenobiotica]
MQMIHSHSHTHADGSTEAVEVDSGVKIYEPGETWYEAPGCHHVRSDNASDDEDAEFVVNMVIETEKLEKAAMEGDPTKAIVVLDVEANDS